MLLENSFYKFNLRKLKKKKEEKFYIDKRKSADVSRSVDFVEVNLKKGKLET